MSDEISAAMTPEEWAEFLAAGETADESERSMKRNRLRRIMADAALNARRYRAAAAITLHGLPFGFTWEDVDALRGAADHEDRSGNSEEVAQLRDLGERIAALLPPRDSTMEDAEAQVDAIVDEIDDHLGGKE